MGQRRQQTLDVVRGIAILFVLVFHLRIVTGVAALDRAIDPLIDTGWVGVDLFFVLSGFLVGRIILADAASRDGFDRRRFFARRALRLWPVLYVYLAVLLWSAGSGGWRMVVPVMLHLQNYADHVPSHLWSLAVEEHFYLVAALALPVLLRRHGERGVAAAMIAILAGCLVLRVGAAVLGEAPRHLQWQTQYRADSLAAGVLIAWVELYRPALLAHCTARRGACLAAAFAGLAVLATIADPRWRFGVGLTIAWAASAALVLAALRAQVTPRLAAPAALLARLGGIAYPLYIWHASVARVADALTASAGIPAPLACVSRYAAAVVVAAAVARWIERPIMRLRDGWIHKDTPRATYTRLIDIANG